MDDEQNPQNEQKQNQNPQDFQEFGMENETNSETPKINSYLNKDNHSETPDAENNVEPRVEPTAEAPPLTPEDSRPQVLSPEPLEEKPQVPPVPAYEKTFIPQAKQGLRPVVGRKPINPAAKRKAILGCLGGGGGIVLIILILSFIFINLSGEQGNPIADLLGINQASFVNGLITIVNIIFVLLALLSFVFTMVGLFRASMAKKDDKETRKKGLKTSVIAGIALLVIIIMWMFVYLYLDGKRMFGDDGKILPPIVTEPEETLNLTAPIEIRFDASNVPIDRNKFKIISYLWDFGDDETGTFPIVTHEYTEIGRFEVLLTVTKRDIESGEELEDQYGTTITIANQALTASFEADPESGVAPLEVNFDASTSVDPDGKIDRYEWDFDEDGEFDDAEGIKAKYEFEKNGTYTVALRVTSTTDEFAIAEMDIEVNEEEVPEAVITITNEPADFQLGVQYIFKADDSSSPNGKISDYEWDFGDGSAVVRNKTANHTFESAGTFEVTLKVTDEDDKEGETTKNIIIKAAKGVPKAVITTDPVKLSGKAPFTVVFDASDSSDSDGNIIDYEWDFNSDGKVDDYGALASYTYSEPGTYTADLAVIDSDDNEGKASVVITVAAQGLNALVSADKVEGTVPLTVNFDASASTYSGGQIVSYEWNFGDNSTPKIGTAKISHKYTSIGNFTVKVKVTGSDNIANTAEMLITVREVPLNACFSSAFDSGPAPLQTGFDPSCSTGTISSYFWNFGDGGTSTAIKPSHTYNSAGTYSVILEVTDSDNTVSTSSSTITVT